MGNKKQLNLNRFKGLLEEIARLDKGDDAEKASPIIEQMLQMSDLLEAYTHLSKDEERLEIAKRIYQCREASKTALQEVFAQHGTTYEEAQKYFNEPKNFKSYEWEDIQSMQQKIQATID